MFCSLSLSWTFYKILNVNSSIHYCPSFIEVHLLLFYNNKKKNILHNIVLLLSEALLSALSRVLREEWKRSIELSTNIVYTFFCFSTYNEFHPVIIQYKIGSLCMDVIDYELKRYDQWKEKVEGKKLLLTPDKVRFFFNVLSLCNIFCNCVHIHRISIFRYVISI